MIKQRDIRTGSILTGRRDGYILVSVLSVLALVSAVTVALLLLSRNTIDSAVIAGQALTEDAMTQSAVALAGYQLFVLKRPVAQVSGQQIRLDKGLMTLSVSTDAGKVDLNGSGKELLAAAYQASGLQSLTPAVFAARVIDWRDADSDLSDNGAEAATYTETGLSYGPRNGPFRAVGDLQWVAGVAAADVAILRPFLTIFNPGGRLNVFSAPSALVSALPGVDKEISDLVAAARKIENAESTARLADLLLVQSSLIDATPPSSYRITIDVQRYNATRRIRTQIVMSAGASALQPYQVLAWTPPIASE